MTYPQPPSTACVLAGQDNFRLLTGMGTPGDIYESEVSALSFVVGPNSDMANYLLTYFSPTLNRSVGQAIISPDRDLIGRIDARNEQFYPGPSGLARRAGRIFISLEDIWDARWRPDSFGAQDQIAFEVPVIDMIQYFTANPSVVPQRSDKTFRYQYFLIPTLGVGNKTWMVIPGFGRKSGFFSFLNRDNITTITATLFGIKTSISAAPGTEGAYQEQLYSQALLTGDSGNFAYNAITHGSWDMFAFSLEDYRGLPMPISITLSDDVG